MKCLISLVFVFFLLANILTSGGHTDWWDGMEAFLVTESMVLKKSAKLHPTTPTLDKVPFDVRYSIYSNKVIQTGNSSLTKETVALEPVYTVRSLLLSAIGVPFYFLALALSIPPITIIGLLVNSILIALTSTILFCFSYELYRSLWISFLVSLIFGFCSFVWPYQTSFWAQPLQGLTLISSTYFLYKSVHSYNYSVPRQIKPNFAVKENSQAKRTRSIVLGGLFLGLSVLAHPTSIILVPGFIVYTGASLWKVRKNLVIYFLLVVCLAMFLVGLINHWRFGSFLEFGYGYFSTLETHNGWAGLIGLLFSPGAGLVFFFPISILLILAGWYMYNEKKGLFLLCLYILMASWLYIGTLSFGFEPFAWSGAIAWGPRYFVPILPFISIILGQLFSNMTRMRNRTKVSILKTSIISLAVIGFFINLVGTLVWYQYGIMYGWEKEGLSSYPNYMDMITWNPHYSPILLHSKTLIDGFVSTLDVQKYLNSAWYWTTYGLAPCPYDSYIYCRFGGVIFLIVLTVLLAIGVVILKMIRHDKSFNPVYAIPTQDL